MRTQKLEERIAVCGPEEVRQYGRSCRMISRLCGLTFLFLLIILQFFTFFVAVNGGYTAARALILALVPVLGPLFCGFQLFFADAGSPLILAALLLPCLLTSLLAAGYRDAYARSVRVVESNRKTEALQSERENAKKKESASAKQNLEPGLLKPHLLKSDFLKPEKNELRAADFPTVKPAAEAGKIPALSQAGAASPLTGGEKAAPAQIQTQDPVHKKQDAEVEIKSPALTKAEEEYHKAMKEVMSLLNKNKP